jgi:uncharacterized protein
MAKLADEVRVVDADTHMTERHDLFTSRAPSRYKDPVPRVVDVDGKPHWIVDESVVLGPARGGGMIDRAGEKYPLRGVQAQRDRLGPSGRPGTPKSG